MATTYKASFEFSCWKQHTCLSCNEEFQYVLKRKVQGEAGTEEAAFVAAQNAAAKAMNEDVDQHACPKCGYVQPDMIAAKQRPIYWLALCLGVGGLLLAFFPALAHGFTIETSAYIAAGAMGAALLLALVGSLTNPNGDLQANLARAEQRVSEGTLRIAPTSEAADAAGRDFEDAVPAPFSSGNVVALVLLAMGLLAAIAPPLVRIASGWPLNDRWYPAVVGPGDESTFYFNQKLSSVKGYWKGQAGAKLENAAALKVANAEFPGKTKESDWGMSISVKGSGQPSNTMWATISIPEEEALANQQGELNVVSLVVFPDRQGDGFNEEMRPFQEKSDVKFAAAGAGGSYHQIWLMGQIAALVLCLFAGVTLMRSASALVTASHPTTVFPIEGAEEGEIESKEE